MDLLDRFQHNIRSNNLFPSNGRLLLAVSGGLDSVVLCELCRQAGYDFAIAHCNFQLRKEESEGDEHFVEALAEKYKVPFYVKKFDTDYFASHHKLSIQEAARNLRYDWFQQLINGSTNPPIGFLLTAHHADDNMETILMNFFKGTGINGLKGIQPKHKNIVRPLIFATKENLLSFAKENGLAFREDSSNSSDKYTRNYFRNQLIPQLEKVFPQVKENLLHNAERFKEINILYTIAVEAAKKKLVVVSGKEIHLPVLKLLKIAALHSVLYEIIKPFGFTAHQTADVIKLLNSSSGKYVLSGSHRVLRNRKWLIISALDDVEAGRFLIEAADNNIIFPLGSLSISKSDQPVNIINDAAVARLDASEIQFPLLLRKWQQGDYFYPLGMVKKKKLSRFFIDQKLSLNEKQQAWVIESGKKIIWIVGMRIDDRFKITGATKNSIQFSLAPAK